MSIPSSYLVLPSREIRTELPKALERFRREGISAQPVVFGAHRKPEAVVIPFELYASLLPLIEDLEIANTVRERVAAGPATPLSDTAAKLGIDLDTF
jgi:antitoxin StbD